MALIKPPYRGFAGGPFKATPIRASCLNRINDSIANSINWASNTGETIVDKKTFSNNVTIAEVEGSNLNCNSGANIASCTFGFVNVNGNIKSQSSIISCFADEFRYQTTQTTKTIKIPATDCIVSRQSTTYGERPNLKNGVFGWEIILLSPDVDEDLIYLTLPSVIPLGATLKKITLTSRVGLDSNYTAGSIGILGGVYLVLNGIKKPAANYRTSGTSLTLDGDCELVWNTDLVLTSYTDRVLIGLRSAKSYQLSNVVLRKITLELENVSRHAFERGW